MSQNQAERLENLDIESILRVVATDKSSAETIFVYDEMPYFSKVPNKWISAVDDASRWKDVIRPQDFFLACARFLIKHKTHSSNLTALLEKLMEISPGSTSLALVAKYDKELGYLSATLLQISQTAFHKEPLWKRWLLLADGPIRRVVTK